MFKKILLSIIFQRVVGFHPVPFFFDHIQYHSFRTEGQDCRVISYKYSPRTKIIPLFSESNCDSSDSNKRSALARVDRSPVVPEMPVNLRRKVQAKRPALGHVVPKQARRGGSSNPKLRPQGQARESNLNNPAMLRISAGSARGRRLESPNVYLRPMMGKVKEAVFSTLVSFGLYDVSVSASTRHLDIFSGSGSVGLESLSRGAAHCTFVDLSGECCACAERNLKLCGFESQGSVVQGDAINALIYPEKVGISTASTFNIVTLCPPYEEVVYADLLQAVAFSNLVTDDTIVMVEYPVELGCLPHVVGAKHGGCLVGIRNRRYGRTVIAMYIVNPTGKLVNAFSRPEEFVNI